MEFFNRITLAMASGAGTMFGVIIVFNLLGGRDILLDILTEVAQAVCQ